MKIENNVKRESLADFVINGFGRYDKAKAVLNIPNASLLYNTEGLKQRLFEYRRQHNIFEVGDYVFLRDSHFTELWIVTNILKDGSIEIKTAVHGYPVPSKCWGMYYGKSNGLIHATNEEIQAGRRLEVCGG